MSRSLRGQFLVAGLTLRDPNFYRTVVLMVEHTPEGAMGLIVNRPTDTRVATLLAEHFEIPDSDELVYSGGPVSEEDVFLMHTLADGDPETASVIPGLYLGSSAESFADVVRNAAEGGGVRYRVFQGYSGWGPKQLEIEMSRNDWLVCPAAAEYVFHPEPYQVWEAVMDQIRRSTPFGRFSEGRPEMN